MQQQLADELVEAVAATTSKTAAATGDEIRAYLDSHFGRKIDLIDLLPLLQALARQGRIDSVSAAPGPDGLPEFGFRPAP